MSKTLVHEWSFHFKWGEMSMMINLDLDILWSSRLMKSHLTITEDCCKTTDEFVELTGVPWSSCTWILTQDLGMSWAAAKFVPCQEDMDACNTWRNNWKPALILPLKSYKWRRIWCYSYHPEKMKQSSQWKTAMSPSPKKAWQWSKIRRQNTHLFLWYERDCAIRIWSTGSISQLKYLFGSFEKVISCFLANVIGSSNMTLYRPTQCWELSNFYWKTDDTLVSFSILTWSHPVWLFFYFFQQKVTKRKKCFADI